MRKRIFKVVFFIMYFLFGGILSYFLPHEIKFAIGFLFACISIWAWKVITKEVQNG